MSLFHLTHSYDYDSDTINQSTSYPCKEQHMQRFFPFCQNMLLLALRDVKKCHIQAHQQPYVYGLQGASLASASASAFGFLAWRFCAFHLPVHSLALLALCRLFLFELFVFLFFLFFLSVLLPLLFGFA